MHPVFLSLDEVLEIHDLSPDELEKRTDCYTATICSMFAYDPVLVAAAGLPLRSIADVLQVMQEIEAACIDGDGLK